MPSPVRQRVELACRGVAVAALAVLGWRTLGAPVPAQRPLVTRTTADLRPALERATRGALGELDLTLDSLPGASDRAWARAVAGAGTRVRWRRGAGRDVGAPNADRDVPLATALEPLPDPSGRVRLVAIGTPGAPLAVDDGAGSVDSSAIPSSGARVLDATLDGIVDTRASRSIATTARRDSLLLRPVLVIASAGWEGKFVAAALEEAGWRVDARFSVAPKVSVRQGGDVPIDTAHYAAVIAVDASAAPAAPSIVRFVREGGGAVIAGEAIALPAFGAILPARGAGRVAPTLGAVAGDAPRRGLDGIALTVSRNRALVLDRTGGRPRAVAARVGTGRVLAIGYEDTWRWRMEGGADAPRLHREWWSAMVGSVVRAPAVRAADAPAVDEMPYASLISALGAPEGTGAWDASGVTLGNEWWEPLLFALLIGGLLAEWASRRLRGIR